MKYSVFLVLEVDTEKEIDFSKTIADRFHSVIDDQTIVNEEGRAVIRIERIEVVKTE